MLMLMNTKNYAISSAVISPLNLHYSSTVSPVWNFLIIRTSNVLPSTHLLQHCSFSNCIGYFDGSHMYGSSKPPPIKKRKLIIDSDSDE